MAHNITEYSTIDVLNISNRTYNWLVYNFSKDKNLERDQILISHIINLSRNELYEMYNIGKTSIRELITELHKYGFKMHDGRIERDYAIDNTIDFGGMAVNSEIMIKEYKDNKLFNEALERIELLNDELNKVKRALIAASEGKPFNESFNDEVFLEEKSFEKKCRKYLTTMMEYLLKLKYCTNDRNNAQWLNIIRTKRRDTMNEVNWMSKNNRDTNLCKFIINNLQDFYETSVEYYKDDANEYPDLISGQKMIPKECPWTLDELMKDLIDDLLDKLPDKE